VVSIHRTRRAFVALLFVAVSDAYRLTQQIAPTIIMTLTQATQALFIVGFLTSADLDEREKLREQFRKFLDDRTAEEETAATKRAGECPHCHKPVRPNNRKRHIDSCPANPTNQ
jgi:hypothetical protein